MVITAAKQKRRRSAKPRLSREAWLEQALQVLARQGNAKLRVETIAAALDVTTGSFYWHFADRDMFLESLVRHWATTMTDSAIEQARQVSGDAAKRLKTVMETVVRADLAQYDVSVRAWAAQEPKIRPIVADVDARRVNFLRSLVAELGFEGNSLDMRVQAILGYLSIDPAIRKNGENQRRLDMLDDFHAMIVAR